MSTRQAKLRLSSRPLRAIFPQQHIKRFFVIVITNSLEFRDEECSEIITSSISKTKMWCTLNLCYITVNLRKVVLQVEMSTA